MIILFIYVFGMTFFEKASVCRLFRKEGTDSLKNTYENEKHDHADVYDVLVELVLTIADGKAAETACADSACHCGETDKADGGDGGHTNKLRNGFMEINAEDESHGSASHASRRLDLAGAYVCESGFNLSGKEGYSTENERYDGTGDTDCRSHDRSGEGNQEYEKNDKGNRTEYVDENIDDEEHNAVRLDSILFRNGKDDANDKSEEEGDNTRDCKHLQGCNASGEELVLVINYVGYQFFKKLCHVR